MQKQTQRGWKVFWLFDQVYKHFCLYTTALNIFCLNEKIILMVFFSYRLLKVVDVSMILALSNPLNMITYAKRQVIIKMWNPMRLQSLGDKLWILRH